MLCGALAEASILAARLGPEAMYHLMHDMLALAQDTVQRYGGTLLQVSGEGFVALFGAPVAHEDHARRAVVAALELRQRLRVPKAIRGQPYGITVRLGLHTGPVVVGPLGQDPQRPYIAASETLQVATRLQQQAASDTILLSAATYALVQAEVQGDVWGAGPSGVASPPVVGYVVHDLLRRRAGVPRRGGRSLSRFVGRVQELTLLHGRLAQAASGQGQVLGIAGEPGMGKSRLLAEFAHSLEGQAVTYCEGHCLAYGSATPYLPIRDLLRQLWNLPDTAASDVLTATVQQRLHEAGIVAEVETLLLLQLLDVMGDTAALETLSPEARRVRTFALLRQLFLSTSQQQPLVLAVENLHWIDPTSDEWLKALVAQVGGTAILLLATYRTGYRLPWLTHSWATQVALSPLTPSDSLVVLQSVPQAAQLPTHQHQAIVAKAAGNPFFVEELTWAAVAHGDQTHTLPLPDTIQAVLAARLDHLPLEAKRLVQIAAVIGPEVPVPLLQRVAGLAEDTLQRDLAHLQDTELLYETRLFPEQIYTFKHALTHEVAYGSLLLERRRVLHARIVEALEVFVGDQGTEQVERLAHHALLGEVWDKAVTYCQQAGAKAWDRAAFREAVAAFEQALQALAHLPDHGDMFSHHQDAAGHYLQALVHLPDHRDTRERALELRLALATALNQLGENGRALVLLGETEVLARALDDRARLGRVLATMAQVRWITGDHDGALAAGRQALALAAGLGDSALQMLTSLHLGQACYCIGDFDRAAALLRRNVEAADKESGALYTSLRIRSRAWLALSLGALGAFAEGRRYGEEALRLAMLEGRGATPVIVHARVGHLYLPQGDLEHAVRVLEQGLALCRASGDQDTLPVIVAGLGFAYVLQGRLVEGRALLEEAIDECMRTGALGNRSRWVAWLSEACRLAGCGEEAWQYARQALDLAQQHKERANEAHALYQLGALHAHAHPPAAAQAEAYYQQALTLATALGMRPLQAHCHLGLGILYATTDRREQARATLAAAIDLYRAMEMTFWLPQAEATLAQVA
jgi:class 3 adenylate cyclase/tetratricopeptide (TPR) repeat protein